MSDALKLKNKHWKVTDTLIYPDGKQEIREYFNTVVGGCSKLLTALLKSYTSFKGIGYWAVGSGGSGWSNDSPPIPSTNSSNLTNEIFRKEIKPEDMSFLDDNNEPTSQVTNRLRVNITFNENEANGELREFALFGGDATSTRGSGVMINLKTHGLIYKTQGMQLKRSIIIIIE